MNSKKIAFAKPHFLRKYHLCLLKSEYLIIIVATMLLTTAAELVELHLIIAIAVPKSRVVTNRLVIKILVIKILAITKLAIKILAITKLAIK